MEQLAIFTPSESTSIYHSPEREISSKSTKPKSVGQMVKHLREQGQDYEFYPTTQPILSLVKNDIRKTFGVRDGEPIRRSVTDVGAGDGRVLMELTEGDRFAIEKSIPLIHAMPKSVYIIGTEFHEQTLLDKPSDVIFSNPPYLDYESFSEKIIREAAASYIYLVIPRRWKNNINITNAIKARNGVATVLGEFDFLEADRKARAVVEVVRISLSYERNGYSGCKTDPFDVWFNEHFKLNATKESSSDWVRTQEEKARFEEKVKEARAGELIKHDGLVKMLESLYQQEMSGLMATYTSMTAIDSSLLKELNVSISDVQASLKQKIKGLKNRYWKELFDNLSAVTERLSTKGREQILNKLMEHTSIDFTVNNATALVIWVIKSANSYFDDQIIDLVGTMTEEASVMLYKSNQRTFKNDGWRYNTCPELGEYGLDYQFILHRVGGVHKAGSWHSTSHNLANRAANLVNDILTVAGNIGFVTTGNHRAQERNWISGKKEEFYFVDLETGKREVLFVAKGFQNGNIHLKFNQKLIMRLNVLHGKLKGWLKTAKQAADELEIPIEEAEQGFNVNMQIGMSSLPLLLGN